MLDCFICLLCDHKNDDTNNTNISINIIKTTAPLLLLKTDRSNATAVGAWRSRTSCKLHVFSIQPKITRKRSKGYRMLQNKITDRPTIRTLKTKSGMESGGGGAGQCKTI